MTTGAIKIIPGEQRRGVRELPQVAAARERDRLARARLVALGNDPVPTESSMSWAEALARHEFGQRNKHRGWS